MNFRVKPKKNVSWDLVSSGFMKTIPWMPALQLQCGIFTSSALVQSKLIHAAELLTHLRPRPLARSPRAYPSGSPISIPQRPTSRTATEARRRQRRRPKLTPTASAALLATSRRPPPVNPIQSTRASERPTERPNEGDRADFFFHRDREREGEKRRGEERRG